MKNYKDLLKEINDINGDSLPDVHITEKQKDKFRNELSKVFNGLKERNRELNIDISEEEVMDISNALGGKSDEYLDGIKHGRLLREIALRAVDEEVKSKYTEILGEAFATNTYRFGKTKTNVGMLIGSALYFKIYITKDTFIMYSFTDLYKVLNKIEVSITDIKSAGLHEGKNYCIEFSDRITYLGYVLEETKNDLDKIINIIQANGVTNNRLIKDRKASLYWVIGIIIFFISMFALMILSN